MRTSDGDEGSSADSARLQRLAVLCDKWDMLSKGETATTRQIREIIGIHRKRSWVCEYPWPHPRHQATSHDEWGDRVVTCYGGTDV